MSNDKFLPIRIFEKRKDYDDRDTEGGGNSKDPAWVLQGDELSNQSSRLQSSLHMVKTDFRKKISKNKRLPVLMTTTLNKEALAKSYRGKIVDVLDLNGEDNVIGLFGDNQLISIVSNESLLDQVESVVSNQENARIISSISDMEIFEPYVEKFQSDVKTYRVRLIDYNDYDRNNMVRILFEEYCSEKGIEIQSKVRFTTDMTIFRVVLDSADMLGELKDFEGLYSAEITYPITVNLDSIVNSSNIEEKIPDEYEEYPIVGVLDTGIEPIPYLEKWKLPNAYTSYPAEYQNHGHGTAVAGIIEYGDELNGFSSASLPGVKLLDAIVYPNRDIYPEDLVENIREAIERNPDVKIWNMSLGTAIEADLDSFSEFGMALDNIQDENNVLIVKSAGNCTNFAKGAPKSRISQSADSIRSLVIGSIAQAKDLNDFADINMPSPFTRVGPGPSNIVKPDLVYYGGNAGVVNGNVKYTGVKSFGMNNEIHGFPGTSFSTPGVARIASELSYLLSDDFDPLLTRAYRTII